MSFQAKDALVQSRQLEAQQISVTANVVAGTVDSQIVSINNSTLAASVITLDVKEPILKCLEAVVRNRATGAIVPLAAAPSIAVANKISVTVDGTARTDVCVTIKYIVQE